MKLLWIARWFPWPANNGARLRAWHLLRLLSQRHTIHLISFADQPVSEADLDKVRSICASVTVVPWRTFSGRSWRARLGFFSSRPRSVVDTWSPAMVEAVAQAAAAYKPDVVVASEIDCAPYALGVPGAVRVLEELQIGIVAGAVQKAGSRLARRRARLTLWKSSRYVHGLLAQMDGYTVASEADRRQVAALTGSRTAVAVVPNGVDLPAPDFQAPAPRPHTLIYSGALTFEANRDAVAWFLHEIFPLVLQRVPTARLFVTGSTTGVDLSALGNTANVTFTGYLADAAELRRAVAGSWLSVVPLRHGAGTRLKILEALALGTPVVSTTKGAEGLELTNGRELLIADSPAAFADAVVRVLGDAGLRATLSAQGRATVSARYPWEQAAGVLEAFLLELLREERVGAPPMKREVLP